MEIVDFQVEGMFDSGSASRITTVLGYQKGVWDVKVLLAAGIVRVSYEADIIKPGSIKETLINIGYEASIKI